MFKLNRRMTPYEEQSLKILGEINEKMNAVIHTFVEKKESLLKKPNDWVIFTQHVREVLLSLGFTLKGFTAQEFSMFLKDKYGENYTKVSDDTIREEFKKWSTKKNTECDPSEFAPVIIKSKSYLRNCRGDILDENYEWVGRLQADGKTINTKFPKPANLENSSGGTRHRRKVKKGKTHRVRR